MKKIVSFSVCIYKVNLILLTENEIQTIDGNNYEKKL